MIVHHMKGEGREREVSKREGYWKDIKLTALERTMSRDTLLLKTFTKTATES